MPESDISSGNPLLSIIIPSFNQGAFIRETIQSCLDQSYRPIEIVVVDGASTDQTIEVLSSFDDAPEVTWVSEPDQGVVDAVNKGLERANGEFAAIQSSDDYYLPGVFDPMLDALLENPELAFVFGDIIKVNEKGMELSRHVLRPFSLENVLSLATWIPQPACFFRLAVAKELNGWRSEVPYAADTDLWFRMMAVRPAKKVDQFVSKRRMHGEQRDIHGDRILRDYRTMLDDWFAGKERNPLLRPVAEFGFLRMQHRYGVNEPRRPPEGIRQKLGCSLFELPSALPPSHWTHARNRNDEAKIGKAGVDTRPLGRWSSDLTVSRVFPRVGKGLMNRALAEWPIRYACQADGNAEPEITFILPFAGPERLPHLCATIESILAQTVPVRCLVVEQSEHCFAEDLPYPIEVLHLPHPSNPSGWHKSWAFNEGVNQAKTPYVICHDADILVPTTYAEEMLRIFHEQKMDVIHPQRFLFCLPYDATMNVLENRTDHFGVPERVRQNWQGGTLAISRSAFLKLGGFDEAFVDWGGEDNEFFDRALSLRGYYEGFLPFLHLWHLPQDTKQGEHRARQIDLLNEKLQESVDFRIAALNIERQGRL